MDTEISSNLCRACLCSTGDFRSLLDSTDLLITFEHITCLQIREPDELPQNICMKCTVKLEDISQFISVCKASDAHLRQLAEKDNGSEICDSFVGDDIAEEHDSKGTTESIPLLVPNPDVELLVSPTIQENKSKTKRKNRPGNCSCEICGKQFTRLGGLQRHMKIHSGIRPYRCKSCNKTFAQKATLERHYLTHTGVKPFECNLCGKVGRRKDQLIEHIQKHHSKVTDFDLVITEHDRVNSSSLGAEAETKETSVKESKGLESEENPVKDDIKYKTKKRIEICLCNLCGKVFQRRGYLKNHMAIHATVKPFICNICGRGFTQRHSLTRHNLVHTKERPFQCNLCGKTFTRKEILTEHIKSHDGASPYLCFHCGKYFSNKDYLKKHLNYHVAGKRSKRNSDEKKCVCTHCGKQLHSISYLKTHLLMHSGEKPYKCNICGNRFTIQRSLNHHLNIHKGIKPYQCTQCEKAFRTSGSLRKHVLLHTGERPYKCTSCDKGFIRRSHLKRHFRTH